MRQRWWSFAIAVGTSVFLYVAAGSLRAQETTSSVLDGVYTDAQAARGAAHSHARRGLSEGLSSEDLEHVALLTITTLGWPRAIRALMWVWDVADEDTAPPA